MQFKYTKPALEMIVRELTSFTNSRGWHKFELYNGHKETFRNREALELLKRIRFFLDDITSVELYRNDGNRLSISIKDSYVNVKYVGNTIPRSFKDFLAAYDIETPEDNETKVLKHPNYNKAV